MMKVCEQARTIIEEALKKNKLSQEEIKKLQDEKYSKNILNINYSFLKKINVTEDISKQIKDLNERNRWWKKIYTIEKENYVICSQWYEKDLEYLKRWVENLDHFKKKDMVKKDLNKKDILENIQKYIEMKGYKYQEEELRNFYLSLKTKPFVILAGISGTGKSKLVELFAEAIGADYNYNIISVKPDWTDSTELLGYKDIKGDFISGMLTRIIDEAKENLDKPYFVCLDEMNLARVEYYLGEYLSLIESRYRNENGEICTKEIFKSGYFTSENKYNGLYFPENLYIVGTVNMDDTTFGFSKKVLDRANTIEFSNADLADISFLDVEENEDIEILDCDNDFMKTNFLGLKEICTSIIESINKEDLRSYLESVNNKIVEIQEILKKYSRHFAFRIRDEIVIYMIENKIADLLDEDIAFDYQFMQKILPIISGSDEMTRKILINLLKLCFIEDNKVSEEDYLDILEQRVKNTDELKYKMSANKIIQMLRGYENGYASYWV